MGDFLNLPTYFFSKGKKMTDQVKNSIIAIEDKENIETILSYSFVNEEVIKILNKYKTVSKIEEKLDEYIERNVELEEDRKQIIKFIIRHEDKRKIVVANIFSVYIFSELDLNNKLSFEKFKQQYSNKNDLIEIETKYAKYSSSKDMSYMVYNHAIIDSINRIYTHHLPDNNYVGLVSLGE